MSRFTNSITSFGHLNSPIGRNANIRFPMPTSDSSSMPTLGNPALGIGRCDKTMCQYCGVSYLTISEMRSLQTTVKEQEQRLAQTKDAVQENLRLKEALASIRKAHMGELLKQEELTQRSRARCVAAENQLNQIKQDLRDSGNRQPGLSEKFAMAADDHIQQEEVICQLREELQEKRDHESENVLLKQKMQALEATLQRISTHPSYHDVATPEKPQFPKFKSDDKSQNDRTKQPAFFSPNHRNEVLQPPAKQVSSLVGVELHDLRRQNLSLLERIRSVTEEHNSCQEMHSFLRDTVDKLKGDNMRLHDETNGLRIQFEESVLSIQNLHAQLQGKESEIQRLRAGGKELESQLRGTMEMNRAIKNSVDPKLVEQLQKTLMSVQRQCIQQKEDIQRDRLEFEERLSQALRETQMERERADSCLTSSFCEREEVEKRWEDRWTRHQTSLNEQLDTLKTNQEKTLATAKKHEEALLVESRMLKERFETSKAAWENYRQSLNEQIAEWKTKYETLSHEFESQRVSKVEVEVLYQTRTAELDDLHEIVREGCEERQDLQKRLENIQESFQEVRLQTGGSSGRYFSAARSAAAFGDSEAESGYNSFPEIKNKIAKIGNLPNAPIRLKTSTSEGQLPGVGHKLTARTKPNLQPVRSPISKIGSDVDTIFTIGKGKVTSGSRSLTIKKKKAEAGKSSDLDTAAASAHKTKK